MSSKVEPGIYIAEGKDTTLTNRSFSAKYEMEFRNGGVIFGTRDNQYLVHGRFEDSGTIKLFLTWGKDVYFYQGQYDTKKKVFTGTWKIADGTRAQSQGMQGKFEYAFEYHSALPSDLYKEQLQINEAMKQNTSQIITQQQSEFENANEQRNSEISQYKKEIHTLREKNQSLEASHKQLENNISSLEHEKKELEMQNIDLKKEIKQFKLRNINTNNYKEWSSDELLHWIISLDQSRFEKYSEILTRSFKEENVDGSCLDVDIDRSDIKLWGINDFKDSKELLKQIKILITKNQHEGNKHSTPYIGN